MLSSFKAFCSWYFRSLALSMLGTATSPGRDRKFTPYFIVTDYSHPLIASKFSVKPLSTFLEFLFSRIVSVSIMFTAIHCWKSLSENVKNFFSFRLWCSFAVVAEALLQSSAITSLFLYPVSSCLLGNNAFCRNCWLSNTFVLLTFILHMQLLSLRPLLTHLTTVYIQMRKILRKARFTVSCSLGERRDKYEHDKMRACDLLFPANSEVAVLSETYT